jgi:hypothetical protein
MAHVFAGTANCTPGALCLLSRPKYQISVSIIARPIASTLASAGPGRPASAENR